MAWDVCIEATEYGPLTWFDLGSTFPKQNYLSQCQKSGNMKQEAKNTKKKETLTLTNHRSSQWKGQIMCNESFAELARKDTIKICFSNVGLNIWVLRLSIYAEILYGVSKLIPSERKH